MKKLFCALFLVGLFSTQSIALAADVSPNKNSNFSPPQVREIEKIVHDYLIKNPQTLVEVGKKLQEKEDAERKKQLEKIKTDIPKYKKQIFDTKAPGRIVLGNPKGKIIITEFTQHQCSHCKETTAIVNKLLENNPEIKLIVVYWPFFGGDAIYTSKAALAAQKQNKGELLNQAFFNHQGALNKESADKIIQSTPAIDSKKLYADLKDNKLTESLKDNFELAQKLGIGGTPTFIFTNEAMTKFSFIPGLTPAFKTDLSKALNEVR